jgi:hypothetical protein
MRTFPVVYTLFNGFRFLSESSYSDGKGVLGKLNGQHAAEKRQLNI